MTGRKSRADFIDCCELTEIFCGAAALSRGFEESKWKAHRFDCRIEPEKHNIHTMNGLKCVAEMLVRTNPKTGLVVMEPTCASWGWVNLGSSLRQIVSRLRVMFKAGWFNCMIRVFKMR